MEETEDPLAPYRVRLGVLANRTIGTASRPVIYDWRKSKVQVAALGSFLLELNNFNSGRLGGIARVPVGGALLEVGVHWVLVGGSPSARLLALTPYRQPGRPDRLEIDLMVGAPIAEGIVTARPRFFPSTQLVLNAYAGLRYRVYPTGWGGLTVREVATAIFSPTFSQDELDNLEGVRLPAMEVDPGRYETVVGLTNDLYFESGFFVSTRALFGVPVLAPVTQSRLLFHIDVSLAIGVAF